jgi:catechol 2,3-dioxygenase-like lactoylglutathione lyase family enzyme
VDRIGSEGMIDHISVGASDLSRSGAFYDAVLAPLGYVRLFGNPRGIGYGVPGAKDEAFAILARGEDGKPHGKGWHVAFRARTRAAVDDFHAVALARGAVDEGAPGLRPAYGPTYYAAFVLDPDGHRLEAVCHEA